MKKLSAIFLILSLLISVNAYTAIDWYQTTNLMGGTIGTNSIGSSEGEDATFTGNLDTNSNTVLPSCTNAKPCPIVVYDAACGSAWCANKEFITVKTITGSSNPYTFTIKARNADSDGPTCTSCAFATGAKFDMVRPNMVDKQMQTVIDGKWNTPTYSSVVGLWTTCSGLLGSGGTCTTDNSSNWNTAYGWGNHASAGYLTSLFGAVLTNQASPQTIGATGTRLTFIWTTGITTKTFNIDDNDAASVAPTNAMKLFSYNKSLAADTDNACGTEVDCITLPIPTTTGLLDMWYGANHLKAIIASDGTATVIEDSDASGTAIEYQAAIADCTGLCLHDGGTNAKIFNDTSSSVTVSLTFWYD